MNRRWVSRWHRPAATSPPEHHPARAPRPPGGELRLRLVLPSPPPEPWPGEGTERIHGWNVRLEDADTGRVLNTEGPVQLVTDPLRPISVQVTVLLTEITVAG